MARTRFDIFHDIYIAGLMFFKPATLFHKIYSLPWYRQTLHSWIDSLNSQAGNSILEVGCATGQLTDHMAGQGMQAVGVDSSASMLRLANISAINNARFELAGAMNLPFADNQFDYVVAASLLNIVSEPEILVHEMLRVCKPGGKISVLVPQSGVSDQAINKLAKELKLSGFSRAVLTTWHRRAPKMHKAILLEYFNRAGLHPVATSTYLNGMLLSVTGRRQHFPASNN